MLLILALCWLVIVVWTATVTRTAAPISAEQQQTQPEAKNDPKLVRAAMGAASVIAVARNPDSVKFSRVFVTENGTACYLWRAQNGFGGMNVEHAVLLPTADNLSQSVALWNSRCAKKEGTDITALVEERLPMLRMLAR